jgi:hypothetical protein
VSDDFRPADPAQHDTAAYARPLPPSAGAQAAGEPLEPTSGWYPTPEMPTNPEAAHWHARYRRQRTITAVLGVGIAVALMAVVGLGVAAWQLARSNPLMTAASDLAAGLGQDPGALQGGGHPQATPDEGGATPGDATAPDSGAPDASGQDIPLPEPLRNLGSALGITDVGDLIDLAVANGLMSAEDADKLRAALAAGAVVGGLGEGTAQ